MAKADTDTIEIPSHETKTVDNLFQFLVCARDIPLPLAKKKVLEALQLDRLRVEIHTRGGARKNRPMRQATQEELQAQQAGATLDHLYETAPPEGITEQVHFQSWDGVLGLTIKDGSLVIVPEYSLDYPWHDYSFTIANWPIVYELWPAAPAALKLDTPAPSHTPPADSSQKKSQRQRRQGDRAGKVIDKHWPGGVPNDISTAIVHRQVAEDLKEESKRLRISPPSYDAVAFKLGRKTPRK